MTEKNYFLELYEEDVKDYVEKKNGLNYVSWAYAWKGMKTQTVGTILQTVELVG